MAKCPIQEIAKKADDASGLEFSDWNGMLPHRSRMSFEEAVRWNDEVLSLFSTPKRSRQETNRCFAEFKL